MKLSRHRSRAISRTRTLPGLLALGLLMALAFASNALAARHPCRSERPAVSRSWPTPGSPTPPPNSTIFGDLGNDQLIATTGTPNLNGVSHIDDGVAAGARADLNTAIGFASAAPTTAHPRHPGWHARARRLQLRRATMLLPCAVTLDAGGDPSAVWIFQATSDLVTSRAR